MARLYQRLTARTLGAALLAAGAAACGTPREPAPPSPPPATWPLATFLDTVDYRLGGVDGDGRALADEIGADGTRVVRVAPGSAPEPIAPGLTASHRFVATLASGRTLIEVAASASAPPGLALVENGVVRPLAVAGTRERFLGVSADGLALRIVRTAESGEEILELRPPGLVRRTLATVPRGFRAAAVSGDGLSVALLRAVHDESDEVVLLDRRGDERRLLLPTAAEGRFRPLGFAADGTRLWLESDDASDRPRLERVVLATGEREVLLDGACVEHVPLPLTLPLVVEAGCDGHRAARTIGGEARWRDLPLPASLGAGARVVQAGRAGPADEWLVLAGARASRELARLPADRLLAPAARGLAARLDPPRLPVPEPVELGNAVVAEHWRPTRVAIGAVVWLLPAEERPDLGRFAALPAFLASRGVAVLRVVPRGAPGTGRRARAATDGDPAAATVRDAAAALAAIRGRDGAGALPVAIVGEGAWSGAIAAAVATDPRSGFAAAVALDPAADPLAVLDQVATAGEPSRSRGIARWGDPDDARVVARRQDLAAAPANPAMPLLVVLDSGLDGSPERAAQLEAARLAGRPVEVVLRPRPAWGAGAGRKALEAVWRHLRENLAASAAAR